MDIDESHFKAVSELDVAVEKQKPYTVDIWKTVKYYVDVTAKLDLLYVGHIITRHATIEPTPAAAQTLAALCSFLPDGKPFPINKLQENIVKTPPEPIGPWDSSSVKNLFFPPAEKGANQGKQPPSGETILLGTLLTAYNYSVQPKYQDVKINYIQTLHTLFATLYLLPRFYRKAMEETADITTFTDKVKKINPNVEPAFLTILLDTFWRQKRWELYMTEGGPITTNVAIAGLVLSSQDDTDILLKSELSFALLGVIYHAFTAYQLLLQVALLDKRSSGEVLRRIPTVPSDAMIRMIVDRKDDLSAKPCWYAIAPICSPDVRADFSLSKQPSIAKTFTLIIKWLDKTQEANLSKLVLKLSSKEVKEATYGYELYKHFAHRERVQATRSVVISGVTVTPGELVTNLPSVPTEPQAKKTYAKSRGETEESSEDEEGVAQTILSAYK